VRKAQISPKSLLNEKSRKTRPTREKVIKNEKLEQQGWKCPESENGHPALEQATAIFDHQRP
jgi:hypothetical protein